VYVHKAGCDHLAAGIKGLIGVRRKPGRNLTDYSVFHQEVETPVKGVFRREYPTTCDQ
jgi:hypothetical protein